MDYKYVAFTPQSKIVKGKLEVPTESMAVESLEQAGLKVLSLKKARDWNISRFLPSSSVSTRDVILFSRQLAILLERGNGFLAALQLLVVQTSSKGMKKILGNVIDEVKAGSTFSSAIAKYPSVFPVAYTRMVMLGEQTGHIESTLRELVSTMEKSEIARKKVSGAMTYPVFLLIIGLITGVIMLTAVLPSITRIITEFDSDMPWNTRMIISVGNFFTDYIYYLLGGALLLLVILTLYIKRPSGRYMFEKLVLKLPLIRRLSLSHNMRGFSRVMAMLVKTGLPMSDVMTIAQQSVSGEVMRRTLAKIPSQLLEGKSLSQAIRSHKLFPPMLVQIVATGEETNTLEESFTAIADHYEVEFDETLSRVMSLIEPVMLVIVGLIIGFIAVSIIMAIYTAYDVVG